MKILTRVLTIMVGAGPATYLCGFAGLAVLFGSQAVFHGELAGFVMLFWGLAGFYGTLSLWAVGFGFVRRWIIAGLIAGIIGLVPIASTIGIVDMLSRPSKYLEVLIYAGPIAVAVAWLGTLAVRMFRRHGEVPGAIEHS